jgi:hypothetical protein
VKKKKTFKNLDAKAEIKERSRKSRNNYTGRLIQKKEKQ